MNPNVTLSALLNKAKRAGSSEDTALQEALGSHLSNLKSYGFDASLEDSTFGQMISIAKDNESYMNEAFVLSWDSVAKVARLTEQACFCAELHELMPRMALLGWTVSHSDIASNSRLSVNIQYRDGLATDYSPTYTDLLKIRRTLDVAEVDYVIATAMPLFKKLGWELKCCKDCYAILEADKKNLHHVPFNSPDVAHKVVAVARAQKEANHIAEEFC